MGQITFHLPGIVIFMPQPFSLCQVKSYFKLMRHFSFKLSKSPHDWIFKCCISSTHIRDDFIGLWVWWRWRRGWWRRWGQDLRVRSVQVLDALPVILAQPQRVGEWVVCGHDGSLLAGVLQAQDVPELMGSNLEKVCACRDGREASEDATTPGSNVVWK